jgi:fumarate reductase subunit C
MSNDKQTAVQILVDSLIKLGYLHSNDFGQSPKVTQIINQAKEIEKEQIIQAHYAPKYGCFSEDYYNETYGGNKP